MSRNPLKPFFTVAAAGIVGSMLAYTPVSHAFNFGDMMNPGKWMGGSRDRYDDDYYDDGPSGYGGGPYGGGGGPYGYGGGPYGGGPYGGYGGPWGGPGFGGPGYGAPGGLPGGPRPAAPRPAATPSPSSSTSSNTKSAEIESLKRRIEELETKQQPPAAPPPSDWDRPSSRDWSSAPAFRPLNKY